MKRILIVAAHPDDEILGCGGIMSKYHHLGALIRVVFIGEGSSCRFENIKTEECINAISFRNSCAQKALEFLGVKDYIFYNLPCGQLDQVPIIKINKIIEQEIKNFSPDTVFTHSGFDANNDHKIIYNSTIMATRPGGACSVPRLFSFEVLSSSEWNFQTPFAPNFLECLSEEDLENKCNALAIYESEVKEFPFPRSRIGVRSQAMTRGMQGGFALAEAFTLIRELKK